MTGKIIKFIALATAVSTSAALADAQLSGEQLDTIVKGNTLYVEIPAGAPGAPDGGIAPIYYAADGGATVKLPAGRVLVGTWAIEGDSYCIDWDNGPQNSCTQLVRQSDMFVVMDAAKGEPRGTVSRIQTGNPEGL
ncbi:MAG: hypothetical protein ABJL67_12365 [Sulfitobacter sp.]